MYLNFFEGFEGEVNNSGYYSGHYKHIITVAKISGRDASSTLEINTPPYLSDYPSPTQSRMYLILMIQNPFISVR